MYFQKKYLYSFLIIIFLGTSLALGLKFWKYGMYIPFLWEKLRARPSNTPLATFDKFQEALSKNNDSYLVYITKETRDQYKKIFSDAEIRERYLQPLTNIQEEYIVDCENKLTCEHIAVYSYDYSIKEPYWEEVSGKRYLIPAGTQKLEIRFVEVKKGYWQINEF